MSIRIAQILGLLCLLIAGMLLYAEIRRADGFSQGVVESMPDFGLVVMLGVGVLLAGLGWPRREGTTLHCTTCGYQHQSGPILPKCPECAANWRWYGGCTRGRLVVGPPFLVAGVPLVLISAGSLMWQVSRPGAFIRTAPTTILLTRLGSADSADTSLILEVLTDRGMSDEQQLGVARRLLNRRLAEGRLTLGAHSWLEERTGGQGLSPTEEARYFHEMMSLSLLTPETSHSGRWFDLQIESHYRGPRDLGRTDLAPWLMLDGVEVVVPPSALSAAPTVRTDLFRRAVRGDRLDPRIDGGRSVQKISVRVDAPEADILRVRLHGWLVFSSESGIPDPLLRSEDGGLVLPTIAAWMEPFELVATIPLLAPMPPSTLQGVR